MAETEIIDGVECRYEFLGVPSGCVHGGTVVFLHGWGGGLSSFSRACADINKLGAACVNFAFPVTVPSDWGIYDYAAYVKTFLRLKNIKDPIVVGHSFGGRIALILAAQGVCGGIVLVDAAGMKPRFSLRKKIRIARYHRSVKRGKPLDGTGSIDYNNLDADMRKVFVRIVNTHLDKLLPFISCKTLVFWGKRDRDTPPYMARRIKRGIKNSTLVFVDGGHYSYIDSDYRFLRTVKSFIME